LAVVSESGKTSIETSFPVLLPPPPDDDWVTLTVMVPEITPLNPGELAVIRMFVQVLLPAVMRPVALTVTQSGVALLQVTWLVMSLVCAG
jgi:hypothetical protein